jgi:hypothetical protein
VAEVVRRADEAGQAGAGVAREQLSHGGGTGGRRQDLAAQVEFESRC